MTGHHSHLRSARAPRRWMQAALLPALGAAACCDSDGQLGDGEVHADGVAKQAIVELAPSSSAALGSGSEERGAPRPKHKQPNVLTIVADDLGFSDLGAFGGEISTPNLDALAHGGRLLTGHRAASVCAPTRAMLVSGTDSHAVGLGRMGGGDGPQIGKPGYEGYLTDRALSVAELLRDAGYHTYIAGKWHLGSAEARIPRARGFERSYVLVGGVASFFNEFADPPTKLQTKKYRLGAKFTEPPKDFYATDFYTDKLISFIESNREDGKPFLAFATYTAPHSPLQAPPEYIDRYRGRYDEGYDAIREARLKRQKAKGLVPEAVVPNPRLPAGGKNPKTWAKLTSGQRQDQARRMEIYAAMVENLDANVGRLLSYLKRVGEYDNTFIFFQSDNGAEGTGHDSFASEDESRSGPVDNSLENLGRRGSYIGYGPRWAEVSATPFGLWKSYTTEGGVAVPAIVKLPGQRHSQPIFHGATHVIDFLPTVLELAGVKNPGREYRGRSVEPITGKSLLPVLEGRATTVRGPNDVLAWEHGNHRYVIRGPWKALWLSSRYGPKPRAWSLFDLRTDRAETHDLSQEYPQILRQLESEWTRYASDNGVVLTE